MTNGDIVLAIARLEGTYASVNFSLSNAIHILNDWRAQRAEALGSAPPPPLTPPAAVQPPAPPQAKEGKGKPRKPS
jgi:hypothetical protein